VTENFFDLGGHSLFSAKMVVSIDSELGVKLPLRKFFQQPTIEGIAVLLDDEIQALSEQKHESGTSLKDILIRYLPSYMMPNIVRVLEYFPLASNDKINWGKLLIPQKTNQTSTLEINWPLSETLQYKLESYIGSWNGIRKSTNSVIFGHNLKTENVPLFWVFQGNRESTQMAKYLCEDQPLYAMRSGHLIMEYTPDDIQKMALRYVEEIEALCPDGPLYVGGNCQAGIIALAIAQHLQYRRRIVLNLFLMEWLFPVQPYDGRITLLYGQDSEYNPFRNYHAPEFLWKRSFSNYEARVIESAHGQFFNEPNIQNLTRVIEECVKQPVAHRLVLRTHPLH